MARHASEHPTDGELAILRVLWKTGPATLGAVCDGLSSGRRKAAKTTVATMLGVMLDKRLVRRRDSDEGYKWAAAVDKGAAAKGIFKKLLDYIFDGSARRMVAHLVEDGRISGKELKDIARLRKQQKRGRASGRKKT